MLHQQPQEVFAWHRLMHHLPGFTVLIPVGYFAILTGNNVFFLNDTTIEITAKLDESFSATTDGFAVYYPCCRMLLWEA